MKKGKVPVIILTMINLILAGIFLVFYLRMDRTAPEFRFQTSDYIYIRSDGESELLDNISAMDAVDGNVTDRIVIEKIVENKADSSIVVFYAVSDTAGNVAKISRVFPAQFEEDYAQTTNQTGAEEQMIEAELPASEITAESEQDEAEQEETEETAEKETGQESEETKETTDEAEEEPAEETNQAQPETPKPDTSGYPVLRMKKNEVTIQSGNTPPWTELIEQLSDDKDNYTTLYYNLHISKFNASKAGDYPVTLQAEDTDGHLSDTVTVTVHVR